MKHLNVLLSLHMFVCFVFFKLLQNYSVHAVYQISLAISCLLYEMHASEKPVQEILFTYLYMLWNVLNEYFVWYFSK